MGGEAFKFLDVFSVKLIMMDQANIFICIPMAEWFARVGFCCFKFCNSAEDSALVKVH